MIGCVYYNGKILTMDPARPVVEAVAVSNGKILAVGKYEELAKAYSSFSSSDLSGKTMMPGFVDGHGHLASTGTYKLRCDLSGASSMEEIRSRILRFRLDTGKTAGQPILCKNYDNNLLPGFRHPTAADLDPMGIDNPVYCAHISGHLCAVNTNGLIASGLDDTYAPDPDSDGVAGRDENGHLNGFFAESAMGPVNQFFCTISDEQFEEGILLAQEEYIANGYTSIQDGSGFGPDRLKSYVKLSKEGKLKVDITVYISATPSDPDYWEKTISTLGNRCFMNHLRIGGIKIVLDGSPQAKTAWMSQPYEGESEYCGYPNMSDEKLYGILKKAVEHDLQPLAHCNGDAASEQFIRVWERVVHEMGRGEHLRPVMIHCQTVRFDQLDRMKKIGMLPSFFVGHCWHWGDVHIRNFGLRAQRISPVKAALERGLVCNFHQDSPVTEPNMLFSVWCAVNRLTKDGVIVGQEQKIDPMDALAAATFGAAYAHFDEDRTGKIAPGMSADFVILDQDPCSVDPMHIKNIRVMQTIKNGKLLYSAI